MYIYKLVPRPPTFKTGSTPLTIWLGYFLIISNSNLAMLILSNFQKRPIDQTDRFSVTLFDLGLTHTAPLGNSTTGLIVTGTWRAFQRYNIWVCVWGHLNRSVMWFCR